VSVTTDPLSTARSLAELLSAGSAERDRQRRFPRDEMAELKRSGLLGLRLSRSLGGAGVDTATIVAVSWGSSRSAIRTSPRCS
jgi:alkylation response protein AidB-like acyl-CoA dehydrogenase